MSTRVFVSGIGLISSIGNDVASVLESLRSGRHGLEVFPSFQRDDCPPKVLGTIKGFDCSSLDPEDWTYPARWKFRRDTLRSLSPHGLFALCAASDAIADAGISEELLRHPSTGLFTASAGSARHLSDAVSRMKRLGVMRAPPMGIVASVTGTLNFNLVAHFGITGSSCGFASACASSAHALGFAFEEVASGRLDRVIVVGAEDGDEESILPFAVMRALSTQPNPALASRPFDRGRDGFVGSGGAAVLVLESEESCAKRGARVYGEIVGWGQASDGYNVAMPHPEGRGLAAAMRMALARAKLNPGQVDYINAHATSTPAGDVAECRAIRTVFEAGAESVAVSSTKALTGHGISLAGALEAALVLLSMRGGFTPGNPHTLELDPECSGVRLERDNLPVAPRLALSNSSGFGGANVSLVLKAP